MLQTHHRVLNASDTECLMIQTYHRVLMLQTRHRVLNALDTAQSA